MLVDVVEVCVEVFAPQIDLFVLVEEDSQAAVAEGIRGVPDVGALFASER
jgi:hypothetical protein